MDSKLHHLELSNFTTEAGAFYPSLMLSYQLFGQELHSAPVVLVNHALTGNSDVASAEKGWWNAIVGKGKLIDTDSYTVLAFDIPGNGYNGRLISDYRDFNARDIAILFGKALERIEVKKLYAAIGGSLGGGIAWEMAILFPDLITHLVPIASDWKASDWMLAHNRVQHQILENSSRPLHDARMMAMLFYRTAHSFKQKFNRSINEELKCFNVESWLLHHGQKLEQRFSLSAYKLMNHLLSTVDITRKRGSIAQVLLRLKATVTMVGIDSDFFFVPWENKETLELLSKLEKKATYKEIKSIHGHDAFLIECEQLTDVLAPVFRKKITVGHQ